MPIEPADTTPPIEVTNSVTPEQLYTLIRQLVLVFGGFATLLGLLKTHDIAGILAFLRSSDFLTAAIAVVTVAVAIYGNLATRWRKKQLIVAARAAPDTIAKVVTK